MQLDELDDHSIQSVPDLCIELVAPRNSADDPSAEWFGSWNDSHPDAEPWLRLGRHEDRFFLRFQHYADFEVASDGRWIRCLPTEATPRDTLHHLLLDQVIPLALSLLGDVVLHASAVEIENAAVGFAGASGRGKSTLAAAFASSGDPLLTDDCLIARERDGVWSASPYYPGARLWPSSAVQFADASYDPWPVAHYNTKVRVGAREGWSFASGDRRLRALFILGDPDPIADDVRIRPASPRDALMALISTSFLLDSGRAEALRHHLAAIGRLGRSVACYELAYPRGFDWLDRVRSAVMCCIRRGESS